MTARHNYHVASPRFPRGLALLSLAAFFGLLSYSVLQHQTGEEASGTTPASNAAEASRLTMGEQRFVQRAFHNVASPESRWATAFAVIEAEENRERREEMWLNLVAQVSLADSRVTLDELQNAGFGDHEFVQRLLRRWVETDGRAAAAWAGQMPVGALRESALSSVAIGWANSDVESAAAWARQLPELSEQQAALLAVANEAVRGEPQEALRIAAELPASAQRDEMIRRAATEWALADSATVVDWASRIPDATLRAQVLAAAAAAWAESAPEAAATFAIETLPGGRLLDDTVVSIVQRWAQQQPAVAAAWVERFPEGVLRVAAIDNLLVQWMASDPDGARNWQAAHQGDGRLL